MNRLELGHILLGSWTVFAAKLCVPDRAVQICSQVPQGFSVKFRGFSGGAQFRFHEGQLFKKKLMVFL